MSIDIHTSHFHYILQFMINMRRVITISRLYFYQDMKCTIEFTSRSSAILTNGLTFVSCSRLVTTILNFFRGICHGPLGIDFSVAFSFTHKFLKWLPKDLAMWKTRVVLFGPKMIYLWKCMIRAIKRNI